MKKFFASLIGALSLIAAVLSAYFIFFFKPETTSTPATAIGDASASTETSNQTSEEAAPVAETGSSLVDGVYTGAVTSTGRGDYQVQLTVADGQMADINVVLYPDGDPNSVTINGNALPIYTAEALANQSAEVNLVSGASEAYKGFTGSLQDALDQAQQ